MPPRSLPVLLVALPLVLVAGVPAAVGPWYENPQSQVRIITPYAVAARAGEFRLGVEFRLAPGWHAYWRNSGDAGFPPSFDLRQTPQLESPRLLWPAPHRYDMPGGLVAFGYADEVVYPLLASLRAGAGDTTGVLPIVLSVDYLVCAVECVPYRTDLKLEQALGAVAVPDPEIALRLEEWIARAPEPAGTDSVRAEIERAGEEYELVMSVTDPSARSANADLIPDTQETFELGEARKTLAADAVTFAIPLTRKDQTAALPKAATFSWVLTGLGDDRAIEGRVTAELPGKRRSLALPSTVGVTILIAILAARRRRTRARAGARENPQP